MLKIWIAGESGAEELLPFCHTTRWKSAVKILKEGSLTTLYSTFPNSAAPGGEEQISYLFYGLPFYIFETGNGKRVNIEKALDFGVAFIFDPLLANDLERFYPFDTGAFFTNRFKNYAELRKEAEYKKLEVEITDGIEIRKYIKRYFDINERYTRGFMKNNLNCSSTEESELYNLLTHKGASKVDLRFRAVEAHALIDIDFSKYLKYVLVPEIRNKLYPDEIQNQVKTKYPDVKIIEYRDNARTNADSLRSSMMDALMKYYNDLPTMEYSFAKINVHELGL